MFITTFEQYKNLPQNRGKNIGELQKQWLFEERKLLLFYEAMEIQHYMTNYADGASKSTQITPEPTGVTYFVEGYFTPETPEDSYYVFV